MAVLKTLVLSTPIILFIMGAKATYTGNEEPTYTGYLIHHEPHPSKLLDAGVSATSESSIR